MARDGSFPLDRLILFLVFPIHLVSSFRFSFSPPYTDDTRIIVGGNATKTDGFLSLTRPVGFQAGRAIYYDQIRLIDSTSNAVSSFSTSFIFRFRRVSPIPGDGFTFFLTSSADNPAVPDPESLGGSLGLIPLARDGDPSNQVVAVEFDTFTNEGRESPAPHVGIDINTVLSSLEASIDTSSGVQFTNMTLMTSWIDFNSTSSVLEVRLGYYSEPRPSTPILSSFVSLSEILGDRVWVGFSAGTGGASEGHEILAWDFAAGGFSPEILSPSPAPSPSLSPATLPPSLSPATLPPSLSPATLPPSLSPATLPPSLSPLMLPPAPPPPPPPPPVSASPAVSGPPSPQSNVNSWAPRMKLTKYSFLFLGIAIFM